MAGDYEHIQHNPDELDRYRDESEQIMWELKQRGMPADRIPDSEMWGSLGDPHISKGGCDEIECERCPCVFCHWCCDQCPSCGFSY